LSGRLKLWMSKVSRKVWFIGIKLST
jgi:hypothetical protein